jgi:uncharacterized GH25 family protein
VNARQTALAITVLAALALLAAPPLLSHDFWIEPSSFHPAVGSRLAISLRVGEHFRGEPVPRMDPLIARFVLASASGETSIGGFPGTDPAGFVRVAVPGFLLVGYRSNRSPITLEPEKFEKYLADEGLDGVLKARAERGEHGKAGVEVYSRCAKSLIAANGAGGSGFDRILGLTLEIIAEEDPFKLRGEGTMRFRVLYEGKPLASALVKAIALDDPDSTLALRSGADGRVSFRLPRKGIWLVKVVHMVPAPKETGADWESLWASLTFEISENKKRETGGDKADSH